MSFNPNDEAPGPVTAILMASGFSKRFGGQNKLMVPFCGKPLARHTIDLVCGMNFSGGIFFITACEEVAALAAGMSAGEAAGYAADCAAGSATGCAVSVIKNTAPEKGLRESVRLGVEACPHALYYLFFPCDQPFLDAETVSLIVGERESGLIVEPRHAGKMGNPCLFSAIFREELLSLKDGETPRVIKARHPEALRGVEITNPLALEDIDDEETLARLGRVKNQITLLD